MFCKTLHKMALRDMKGHDEEAIADYEDDLYDELCPLIFDRCDDINDEFTFNPEFCDWVEANKNDSKVCDFPVILTGYINYIEYQRNLQLEEQQDVARRQRDILDAIRYVKANKAIELRNIEAERTTVASVADMYNEHVREINKKNGAGLLPVYAGEVSYETFQYMYSTIVLSHKLLLKIFQVDYHEIDVTGCAVIYNTYTERYLVIKAEKVYSALKMMMQGQVLDYIDTFGYDLLLGHKILVRVIPLDASGYSNLDILYRALIRAYDSLEPHGYNSKKYLDK